jgi:hypothetical protein
MRPYLEKNGLVEWLKVQALSLNPSISQKKKKNKKTLKSSHSGLHIIDLLIDVDGLTFCHVIMGQKTIGIRLLFHLGTKMVSY